MAVTCYIILRRAGKEYRYAREPVEDITLSFNRQLRNESEKLERASFKLESLSVKSETAIRKSDENKRLIQTIEATVASVIEDRGKVYTRLDEINKQLRDIISSQAALTTRVTTIEGNPQQSLINQEGNIDAVIPIKRDRALAPLTETELAVLEMLSTEGPKTAPEIKERVKLSREHTARLMKKLYEDGYLERDTSKTPFKYSVKKEMEKLLKRSESE